ncbi:hypothetical protein HDU76_003409 [Blyttiomyces sp. JEL0837]|nr:hypothetical protein HDU76_003409 [Blyttiomyces sp. JEL0837]
MSPTTKTVTIITGGARGIGAAIAKEIATTTPNSAIVINYRSSSTEADALVTTLQSLGASAIAVQADVGTSTGAKKLIDTTIDTYGHITNLINNAGVSSSQSIDGITESEYDYVFNSNVKATVLVASYASKYIVDHGSIVNISSVITHTPSPGYSVYIASKGAVESFTRALAVELATRKITVNTVSPGITQTPMLPDAFVAIAGDMTPFKRVGTPEDIAGSVAFLTSEKSRWVTGQNLFVSGGISYSF